MKGLFRWLKRAAIVLFVLLLVVAVVVYGGREYMREIGSGELKSVTGRLDVEEPGWRFEAIEPRRQKAAPPEEKNSAMLVLKVAEMVSRERNAEWNAWRNSDDWMGRMTSPHLPPDRFQTNARAHKQSTAAARLLARDLRRFPTGYYPLTIHQNPYMTLLPHLDKARQVAALLEYDALLAALEGDPEGGIVATHAALNLARSIGDEPSLISQLVRIACNRVSTQSAAQLLAWGEPKRGLAELQTAYRAEADEPWLLYALQGERAGLHRMFEGLESGKLTFDDLVNHGMQTPGPGEYAAFRLYKGLLPGDHAKALEILTQYIAAAKLPPHEQAAAFKAVAIPPGPPDDFRYIVTRLLIPACEKVAMAALRSRAELLAASVLIACERHRVATGKWPERLEEIPKGILPDIPSDPYTGQPLRYTRLAYGVAVYSVGDGDPNTMRHRVESKDPLAGIGIGWRLWDADKRGQPPAPEQLPPGGPDQQERKQP